MSTVEKILNRKGPDVITAPPSTTVDEAARLMAQADVGCIMVKQGNQLYGIFTERDLLKRVVGAGKNPSTTVLAEVMTGIVQSCRLADSVQHVRDIMNRRQIRHLPVIEDGSLVGMISLRDILDERVHELEDKG